MRWTGAVLCACVLAVSLVADASAQDSGAKRDAAMSSSEDDALAAREAESAGLERFEGGDSLDVWLKLGGALFLLLGGLIYWLCNGEWPK